MDTHDRAGHAGTDPQTIDDLRNPAYGAPHKGTVWLLISPWMIVIGYE
jgi:hypothetical protein